MNPYTNNANTYMNHPTLCIMLYKMYCSPYIVQCVFNTLYIQCFPWADSALKGQLCNSLLLCQSFQYQRALSNFQAQAFPQKNFPLALSKAPSTVHVHFHWFSIVLVQFSVHFLLSFACAYFYLSVFTGFTTHVSASYMHDMFFLAHVHFHLLVCTFTVHLLVCIFTWRCALYQALCQARFLAHVHFHLLCALSQVPFCSLCALCNGPLCFSLLVHTLYACVHNQC